MNDNLEKALGYSSAPLMKRVGLYYFSASILQHTASWVAYGGFSPGHPSFFNLEEYFASSGTQFFLSFIYSMLVWWLVNKLLVRYKNAWLWFPLIISPLFCILVFEGIKLIQSFTGWVFIWDGSNLVWIYLLIALFYGIHLLVIYTSRNYELYKKERKRYLEKNTISSKEIIPKKRIKVTQQNTTTYLDPMSIRYIEAFGDYTKIYSSRDQYLSNSGIGQLEKELESLGFLRIHRSHLVNTNKVQLLEKKGRYHYLQMSEDVSLKVSAHYLAKVKSLLA